jgi:hypothetical protein
LPSLLDCCAISAVFLEYDRPDIVMESCGKIDGVVRRTVAHNGDLHLARGCTAMISSRAAIARVMILLMLFSSFNAGIAMRIFMTQEKPLRQHRRFPAFPSPPWFPQTWSWMELLPATHDARILMSPAIASRNVRVLRSCFAALNHLGVVQSLPCPYPFFIR